MNKPAFTRNNRGMILVHLVFWNKRKITITIIWGKNKPIIITVTIIWGKNKPIIITISNYDSFFLLLIAHSTFLGANYLLWAYNNFY